MKKKLLYIVPVIAALGLLLAFGIKKTMAQPEVGKPAAYTLTSKDSAFVAGAKIQLAFTAETDSLPQLVLTSSYGTTLLQPAKSGKNITFTLPAFFARKAGKVSWQLTEVGQNVLNGSFTITPETKITHPEDYLGPRSTLTGDGHYTMMVAAPTDGFDNPKPEQTPVTIKTQFLESIDFTTLPTQHFIAWKLIYAPEKSGKVLTSVACMGVESKETETDVYANLPVDFTLGFSRNHDFADGNQETTISTSALRDKFGNIAEDGTLVTFTIQPLNGALLKTYGTTINGVAEAKLLAPDREDTYTVTAYVNGMAQSTPLTIGYKPIKTKITATLNKKQNILTVGPLHSFMGQLAPDGTEVTVTLHQNGRAITTLTGYSSKGKAAIELPVGNMKGAYTFTIWVLGNTTATQTIIYE